MNSQCRWISFKFFGFGSISDICSFPANLYYVAYSDDNEEGNYLINCCVGCLIKLDIFYNLKEITYIEFEKYLKLIKIKSI